MNVYSIVIFYLITTIQSCIGQEKPIVQFESLSEALISKKNAQILRLNNNSEYDSFPEQLFELRELRDLSFFGIECDVINIDEPRGCKSIRTIPAEITQLSKLEYLGLTGHRIEKIPLYLKELTNLKVLNLGFNRGIDLSNIGSLQTLKELYLHDCRIESIPEGILRLKGLKRLVLVDNPLSEEDKAIIRKALPNCQVVF